MLLPSSLSSSPSSKGFQACACILGQSWSGSSIAHLALLHFTGVVFFYKLPTCFFCGGLELNPQCLGGMPVFSLSSVQCQVSVIGE